MMAMDRKDFSKSGPLNDVEHTLSRVRTFNIRTHSQIHAT
jgi:hypothetical protein